MKKLIITGLLAITTAAWAQTVVKVEDAWVRGTVATQKATGAFMRLTPSANARLVAAESPVAGVVEIHEMAMEKDVMRMRQIPGLDLAAGRTTELKPGGYHVMLMDLKQPLQAGQNVPITLVFEDAARQRFTQQIAAPVQALGAGHGHNKSHGGHKH
ncbi:MAG TPA: copper chaperone PCu(A)C [Hydrogenophaga sp.]|uniref:copper chaperone PCu(A)C n=1 Tax=Hydrogenophaga sp. TaxID=1904254 RepID=UPI002CFD030A|nr:copper chaperone PCu(A)C [Hydrogenophaga sp.]HMN93581.1 copper chaperone PCu(A)C [Hydrogenophaga sp.]HMP09100.1 copper chaperone PCu(A)C [Hydrogenophaga sp.]